MRQLAIATKTSTVSSCRSLNLARIKQELFESTMSGSPFKPGVTATIIIAICILIFTLLFIFAKRQIMRFAQKFSTDGPHAPIGYDAPKKLVTEIERRLNIVKEIRFEPKLINEQNIFTCDDLGNFKHIYRMKAIDSLKRLEDEIVRACGNDESVRRHPGTDLRVYLLNLRKENMPLAACESKLINEFVESYRNARSDPIPDFGAEELDTYMAFLDRIQSLIISRNVQSKASSPLNPSKRKTSKRGSNNQTVTLTKVSPTKVPSAFQTQILQQDDSKGKENESCV